jgi:hypothetical protein
MGQRNVRVVVGQGDPDRQGFLRTVLEDDGFDVVGEASAPSPLARLLTDERPDVVVLDDAIGVAAVELVAEIVPSAKIVVVWPAAVMPIAGAIRVEPSDVLQGLGATVAVAAGLGLGVERPEWIERVRKDPATLRELLAARGGVPTRPSVTELQRRGHRLHPSPGSPRRSARSKAKPADTPAEQERRAVVTPLPLAAATAAAAATPGPEEAAWNRRLGIIALGGAAVAGALMIALAFSNRAPSITAAEPFIPPIVQPSASSPPPSTGGQQGGGNQQPNGGGGSAHHGSGNGNTGGTGGGTTTGTGSDVRGTLGGTGGGTGTGPGGGGNGGTGGSGGGGGTTPEGNPGGPRANDHLPGTHGNGGGNGGSNGGSSSSQAPGNSGSHNPHGGPPAWGNSTNHAGHSSHGGASSVHGNGHAYGHSKSHGNSHAHKQ